MEKRKDDPYRIKTEAVEDLVGATPENTPHYSEEELKKIEKQKAKKYLEVLYSNPAGFRLTAGMTTNYRQLKTIYAQRKNHRLPEWRTFCKWIETLPMSELITGESKE